MLSVKQRGIKYHLESLIRLDRGLNPGLPDHWRTLKPLCQWVGQSPSYTVDVEQIFFILLTILWDYFLSGWLVGWLFGFMTYQPLWVISGQIHFYTNNHFYFKQFSLTWLHSLFQTIQLCQTVLIQRIQFSISIDFVYAQLNVKAVLY